MEYYQHPSAIVDEGAEVGVDTKIWHFSHIMSGASIGRRCIFGQNVFVASGVVVGDGVKIQNNVSIYEGVVVEDDVFLGPSMVFTNVINPRSFIERKEEFKPTLVKRGATVGANATIVCGNTIGEYALVGAGSVVTASVKAYQVVVGVPAKHFGWVSKGGFPLQFDDDGNAFCKEEGTHYQLDEYTFTVVAIS